MFPVILGFCIVSFLGYGLSCLLASRMVGEFERYGLVRYRILTGVLQVTGAVGLLGGLRFPWLGGLAAAGLAALMLLGFGVRLKIRDGFLRSLPALLYMALSAWLCVQFAGLR